MVFIFLPKIYNFWDLSNLFWFSLRNAVPPIRFFRRWVGLDPVPIIKKLDKTESHLEKIKKDHKENMEGLRKKLEELEQKQSEG